MTRMSTDIVDPMSHELPTPLLRRAPFAADGSIITDTADLGSMLGIRAHPDDEALLSGGSMAAAADNGQRVCVTAMEFADRWQPLRHAFVLFLAEALPLRSPAAALAPAGAIVATAASGLPLGLGLLLGAVAGIAAGAVVGGRHA